MHLSKRSCQPGSVFQSFPIVSNRCEMFRVRKRDPCLPACVWFCSSVRHVTILHGIETGSLDHHCLSAHWHRSTAARSGGIISLRSCYKMPLVGVRRPWAESQLKGYLDHLHITYKWLKWTDYDRFRSDLRPWACFVFTCFYRRPVGFPHQDSLSLIDSCGFVWKCWVNIPN